MISNKKAQKLRKDFPILNRKMKGRNLVYLDNAATTQKPKQVIAAISNFYAMHNANIHRGIYTLSTEATEIYERARSLTASFIGADSQEIIFTKGTTESINLLAYSLPALFGERNKRKKIVLTEMEHHSNLVPWQQLAKREGMRLEFIKMKEDFTLDYEDARRRITKDTAVLSFGHVSNALGTVHDAKKLIAMGKNAGAFTVVDAAQSVPHIPINVSSLGADFVAFSSHKMLGPTGFGVLYGKKDLLQNLPPFLYGGDMVSSVSTKDAEWNNFPMKFEGGTQNIAAAAGHTAAIEYLLELGMNSIASWEKELMDYLLRWTKSMKGIRSFCSKENIGIFSFIIEGTHPHDAASLLNDCGVAVRAGHHCAMPLMKKLGVSGTLRASLYFYNTKEDIDTFIQGIAKVQGVFHG